MDRALNYLGIARKAGCLAIGEENAGAAIRSGKGKVLCVASDASDNAVRRAEGFVYGRSVPLVRLPYTMGDIAERTGKTGSMSVITDIGLASSFMSAIAEERQEFSGVAEALRLKNEKAERHRREQAAHDRNRRTGKRRKTG